MKKLSLFLFLLTASTVFANNEIPECSKHEAYNRTIQCTRDAKKRIDNCQLVDWSFLSFPVNKGAFAQGSGISRYLCLSSRPGKIGNDGQQSFETGDIGFIFDGSCNYLIKIPTDKASLSLSLGIKNFYKYHSTKENNITLILEPGTYTYYTHIVDYSEGDRSGGDPNYNAYLKTACDDTIPVVLNLDYEIL